MDANTCQDMLFDGGAPVKFLALSKEKLQKVYVGYNKAEGRLWKVDLEKRANKVLDVGKVDLKEEDVSDVSVGQVVKEEERPRGPVLVDGVAVSPRPPRHSQFKKMDVVGQIQGA